MTRRLPALLAGALVLALAGGLPAIAQDPPLGPPAATPIAEPPDVPAGDGTGVRLTTEKGDILIGLFTESSPVAAENFLNLVNADFYDGVVFHRLVPGFVIQGGDPEGTGQGGPGYTIPDEPVVGRYGRGIVAMARTQQPNSQGSQFFIVLDDEAEGALASANTYAIFGRVLEGMDVADAIAAMPNSGEPDNTALEPVKILGATVEQVTLPPEPIPGDPELEALFPLEVNGEPFAVESTNGGEIRRGGEGDPFVDELDAVLVTLGKRLEDFAIARGEAYGSDGGVFVSGLRVQGATPESIRTSVLPLFLGFTDLQETTATVGGREVVIVTDGPDNPDAQRFHTVGSGDTLFVVQGDEPWLTDAISRLPS